MSGFNGYVSIFSGQIMKHYCIYICAFICISDCAKIDTKLSLKSFFKCVMLVSKCPTSLLFGKRMSYFQQMSFISELEHCVFSCSFPSKLLFSIDLNSLFPLLFLIYILIFNIIVNK